jgi:hypothetical protein
VGVELLGELALLFEAGHDLGDLVADGDNLERDDVALAGIHRAVEVGEAEPVVARLTRHDEALELLRVVLGSKMTRSLP